MIRPPAGDYPGIGGASAQRVPARPKQPAPAEIIHTSHIRKIRIRGAFSDLDFECGDKLGPLRQCLPHPLVFESLQLILRPKRNKMKDPTVPSGSFPIDVDLLENIDLHKISG
jgi:hypothetical protein